MAFRVLRMNGEGSPAYIELPENDEAHVMYYYQNLCSSFGDDFKIVIWVSELQQYRCFTVEEGTYLSISYITLDDMFEKICIEQKPYILV